MESGIVPIPSETAGSGLPHSSLFHLCEMGQLTTERGKIKGFCKFPSSSSDPHPCQKKCAKCWMAPRGVLNFLLRGQAGLISFEITADRGTQNESLREVI